MKYLILLFLLSSCATHYFTYQTVLTKPKPNELLVFEDSIIKAKFRIDEKMLTLRFDNKSNHGLKIPWDDVSLALNGNSKRVVHKETGITKINDLQPATTVSPGGYLQDGVIPSENVTIMRTNRSYVTNFEKIFPMSDFGNKRIRKQALSWKGKDITLFVPFRVGDDVLMPYTFNIHITDVTESKSKSPVK